MSTIIGGTSGVTFPDGTTQTTAATTPTAVANLSGGSAGKIPFQTGSSTTSFTAAGTSGQVLTSAGTGTPTWSTPSAGAMTLISTQTISNGTWAQFTGLSGYSNYFLDFHDVIASTTVGAILQLGYGSGPTWITSSYTTNGMSLSNSYQSNEYNGSYQGVYLSNYNTGMPGSPYPTSGKYYINDTNQNTLYPVVTGQSGGFNTSGSPQVYVSTGSPIVGLYIITAIRFGTQNAQTFSGIVSLYGITS